jgi:hypothetical protein
VLSVENVAGDVSTTAIDVTAEQPPEVFQNTIEPLSHAPILQNLPVKDSNTSYVNKQYQITINNTDLWRYVSNGQNSSIPSVSVIAHLMIVFAKHHLRVVGLQSGVVVSNAPSDTLNDCLLSQHLCVFLVETTPHTVLFVQNELATFFENTLLSAVLNEFYSVCAFDEQRAVLLSDFISILAMDANTSPKDNHFKLLVDNTIVNITQNTTTR